jgi:hypothetical protein
MNRNEIKDAHERSVVDSFARYLVGQGRTLTVQGYPDPPDAMVELDGQPGWIEITDAFIGSEFARSLTSYAADDRVHIPVEQLSVMDPDANFSEVVRSVVEKKYAKASIGRIYERHGPGVLLVGLYSPFLGNEERAELIQRISAIRQQRDGRFKEIYVYDQAHNFYPVP